MITSFSSYIPNSMVTAVFEKLLVVYVVKKLHLLWSTKVHS
jgi:hypothetical protein